MPVSTPTITGGTVRAITVAEGTSVATTVVGNDLDAGATLFYSIVGGADKSKFKINKTTGEVTFVTPPDFEAPKDSTKDAAGVVNGTNTYELIVQVMDGAASDPTTLKSLTQTITVTISNVNGVTINGTTGNDTALGTSGTLATVETDTINGLDGNDTMNGGLGADVMNGGLGNDTYVVDNAGDEANENANEGTDTVQSSITYTISDADVENLTLTGTKAINATGNASNNTLTGNSGANKLDGLGGADTMIGAAGSDVYVVDNVGDVVTELDGQGTDRVESSITYTLGSFVENLTLTGTSAINGTGNALKNVITGNSAINTLTGGGANDTLDGGANADVLVGGTGDDTYIVDNTGDAITEASGAGTGTKDAVKSSVSYTLATNVENMTLTGALAINGTGNASNNKLTGNSAVNTLTGLDGNDTIDGGKGADTMVGGNGDDEYKVDSASDVVTEASGAGTGTDNAIISVSGLTLFANVENATLSGTATTITGNILDNELTGNTKVNTINGGDGNDTIDGMSGGDTMVGGLGNDTYMVDNAADVVTEASSAGTDKIISKVTIGALAANVENVELFGSSAINATGNILDNVMTGNAGRNTLTALDGNDTLDGGRGYDTLVGGIGNDTYFIKDVNTVSSVPNVWDAITENSGEGTDTVRSTLTKVAYTLAANVENLILDGTGNINGNGNSLNNVITGNAGWNIINGDAGNDTIGGGAGSDTINGGAGQDALTGGADVDTFVWSALTDSTTSTSTADTITDFQKDDIIDLSALDAKTSGIFTGDQAFVLDTNGTLVEGEIMMTRSGNVITLSVDTDATAGANMVLQITVDSSIPTGVFTVDNFIL